MRERESGPMSEGKSVRFFFRLLSTGRGQKERRDSSGETFVSFSRKPVAFGLIVSPDCHLQQLDGQ